ncbi:hypothetical protein [Paraliomyxa miuraensis]|uniref:hypothetical protein n=1 Tax=Paraliomyxa miuraensis TaxID=376150 RepID=UPI0022523AB3|nr:hypothetical protein [Paraliomyxa miuraensis]MCX4241802.1 hypothetical protein [Paraliomyxa miuraensis]
MTAATIIACSASVPSSALACNETQRLCVEYALDLDDDWDPASEIGSVIPARGARVTVFRPPPEPPLGFYLDEDGCADFPTQFAAGHKVVVHPSALLGSGQNFIVTSHDWQLDPNQSTDFDSITSLIDEDLDPSPRGFCNVGPADDADTIICTTGPSEISNLMAIATYTIHSWESLPGSFLDGEHRLRLVRMVNAPHFAFRTQHDGMTVAIGAEVARRKFIVAHEIGHWLQGRAQIEVVGNEGPTGREIPVNYHYPRLDHVDEYGNSLQGSHPEPPCQFAIEVDSIAMLGPDFAPLFEAHGLRSAEYSNAAMVEGFAHFAASAAFNSINNPSGAFLYYKTPDLDVVPAYGDPYYGVLGSGFVDLPGTTSPVTSTAGRTAWLENSCGEDWEILYFDEEQTVPAAVSSEIDWLRFFWEFLTLDDTPQPTFWDVVYLLAFTRANHSWVGDPSNDSRVWEYLVETLDDGNSGLGTYKARFVSLNGNHSVWYEPSQ